MPGPIVNITVTGDARDAQKAFKDTGDAGEEMSGRLGRIAGSVAEFAVKLATIGTVGAVGAIAGLERLGSSFDTASDKIRVAIGDNVDDLSELKTAFNDVVRNVPVSFGDASTAIATVAQKLTEVDVAQVSTQFLNLSRITGTDLKTNLQAGTQALQNFSITGDDAQSSLDLLFRASQQSGLSFDALSSQVADAGTVLRGLGFTFDQSVAFIAELGHQGLAASDVMPGLSKSIVELTKAGYDSKGALQELVQQIIEAPDDLTAATLAMGDFGNRAGPKLAQAIREGKLSFDDMLATIDSGTDTINKAASDTDDWREKLTLLKNRAFLALEPIANRVFAGLTTAVERFGPRLATLTQTAADLVRRGFAAIQPYAIQFGGFLTNTLIPAVQQFAHFLRDEVIPALQQFGQFLSDNREYVIAAAIGVATLLVPAMIAYAASAAAAAAATIVAIAPFIAIGAAAAALAVGILYLWNHFETFRDIVKTTVEVTRRVVEVAFDAISGYVEGVIREFQGIIDFVAGVFTGDWSRAWNGIKNIFGGVFDQINSLVGGKLDDLGVLVYNKIIGFGRSILDAGRYIGSTIVGGILDGLYGIGGAISGFAGDAIGAVADAARGIVNGVIQALNDLIPDGIPAIRVDTHVPFLGVVTLFPGIDFPHNPIPSLASGGIATKPTLALVGEAGPEAIVPLNGRNGYGNNYYITVESFDPTRAGQLVRDAIKEVSRRNGGRAGI